MPRRDIGIDIGIDSSGRLPDTVLLAGDGVGRTATAVGLDFSRISGIL